MATFSLYIRKRNVTLSILLLREMSTYDVGSEKPVLHLVLLGGAVRAEI